MKLNAEKLRDGYFSGADLRSADLQYADLHGADLSGVNLRNADLRNADLRGADLKCTGVHYFFDKFDTVATPEYVRAGCKMMLNGEFDQLDEEKVKEMDIEQFSKEDAVAWWNKNKDHLKELSTKAREEGWATKE